MVMMRGINLIQLTVTMMTARRLERRVIDRMDSESLLAIKEGEKTKRNVYS
jgi:hypothetical protein